MNAGLPRIDQSLAKDRNHVLEQFETVSAQMKNLLAGSDENKYIPEPNMGQYQKLLLRQTDLKNQIGVLDSELGMTAFKRNIQSVSFNPELEQQRRRRQLLNKFLANGMPRSFDMSAQGEKRDFLTLEEASFLDLKSEMQYGCSGFSYTTSSIGTNNLYRPQAVTRSDNATGGQTLVQETVYPGIVDHLQHFGGVMPFVNVLVTGTGGDLKYPARDAANEMGVLISQQGTAAMNVDLGTITDITFTSYTYGSNVIRITREIVQDAVFDITGYAEEIARRRLGKIMNNHFTVGTGTGQPLGLVTSAKAGVTAASTTAVTYQELVDLIYSVDLAYREGGEMGPGGLSTMDGGMTGFMISDGARRMLMSLTDTEGRPLWIPSTREGAPGTILGWPYVVNSNMANPGPNAVSILFGNFSYYLIRIITDMEIFRFMDSATMILNSIWCLGYVRADARPIGVVDGNGLCQAYAKLTHAAA